MESLPHSAPEEKPIPSQRDEGWAEEWLYFHPPANQPASRPTAYLITDHILARSAYFATALDHVPNPLTQDLCIVIVVEVEQSGHY